ncbi:MAG: uroporphyrinogen decarboxylase family protein [Hungatella sp.]
MTKRERVIAAMNGQEVDGIPSGFSLHFPIEEAFGDAAVESHLKFFKETDTDILKIMNENLVPYMGEIKTAADFGMIRTISMQDQFMKDQVELVKKILDRCDPEGFTMGTLHGITASSIHPLEKMGFGYDEVRKIHANLLKEDPKPVLEGMKRIADGMCQLAQKYVDLGVDSVYYAALGAETRYLTDEQFAEWIEPFDKMIMTAIKEAGGYCFLHMCKDQLNMKRYQDYGKYVDVVNWGIYEVPFSMEEGRNLFPEKTIMGGLPNRSGVLVEGSDKDVKKAVEEMIHSFGRTGLILGADCTMATEQDLSKVRAAVEAARAC